jgi:hypothetical protein
VIDDEGLYRASGRLQLQSELIVQSLDKRRTRRIRHGTHIGRRRTIRLRRPFDLKIKSSREPSAINNRPPKLAE